LADGQGEEELGDSQNRLKSLCKASYMKKKTKVKTGAMLSEELEIIVQGKNKNRI
jgi:hypothetical protein